MLASIGAGAQRGLLIKGGRYLELLAQADVLLIDKTGTVTLGKPQVTDIADCGFQTPSARIGFTHRVNSQFAIRNSQSCISPRPPSATRSIRWQRRCAPRRGERALELAEPADFTALPGLGVRATVDGVRVAVGNRRLIEDERREIDSGEGEIDDAVREWEAQGKTTLFVAVDGVLVGRHRRRRHIAA